MPPAPFWLYYSSVTRYLKRLVPHVTSGGCCEFSSSVVHWDCPILVQTVAGVAKFVQYLWHRLWGQGGLGQCSAPDKASDKCGDQNTRNIWQGSISHSLERLEAVSNLTVNNTQMSCLCYWFSHTRCFTIALMMAEISAFGLAVIFSIFQ